MQVLINLGKKSNIWNTRSRVLGWALRHVLEGLVKVNQYYMMLHNVPALYESGVIYREEPDGTTEEFAAIPVVLERKWGDCDDLAPFRCAELRSQGENATIRIIWKKSRISGRRMYHVIVRRENGDIEDPSAVLGMPTNIPHSPSTLEGLRIRKSYMNSVRGLLF